MGLAIKTILVAALVSQAPAPPKTPDQPPNAVDVDKVCAERACRVGGYEAVLGTDKDHYTTIPVTRSPYLPDDSSVLIFPGETIAVQFAVDGDKLGSPVSVKRYAPHFPAFISRSGGVPEVNSEDATFPQVKADLPTIEVAALPPNTLLLSYGQFKPKGETGMVLTLEHNLPHTVKLDVIIAEITPGAYKQHYTSSCPIMPKVWGNENWPNALGPIVLTKFRFLPDGGTTVSCE